MTGALEQQRLSTIEQETQRVAAEGIIREQPSEKNRFFSSCCHILSSATGAIGAIPSQLLALCRKIFTYVKSLFRRAPLSCSMSGNTCNLRLHRDNLKNDTLAVFTKFAETIIRYKPWSIRLDFRGERATDAGGPRRDFISALFMHLPSQQEALLKPIGTSGIVRPMMSESPDAGVVASEKKFFHQLGALLNFSFHSCKEPSGYQLLIGPLFEESFYQTFAYFDEELLRHEELSPNYIKERRDYFFDAYNATIIAANPEEKFHTTFAPYLKNSAEIPDNDFPGLLLTITDFIGEELPDGVNEDDPATIRAHLPQLQAIIREEWHRQIDAKIVPYFTATHAILHGMMKVSDSYQSWRAISSEPNLCETIQGSLDAEKIITNLSFDLNCQNQDFLKRWIRGASKSDLQNFLQAVTGSRSLGSNSITVSDSGGERFSFSTCGRRLAIPNIFGGDFPLFKQALEAIIVPDSSARFNMS